MCTKKLWRLLGAPSPLQPPESDVGTPTKLGRWSANAVGFAEGDLVLAINELTYLAVAFPLMALPDFLLGFGGSVGRLLSDLGYPDEIVRSEAEPFFTGTVFAKNGNRSLIGTLNDLSYHVDAALDDYGGIDQESLAKTQLHLSCIPHVNQGIPVPRDAARLLFCDAAEA